MFSFIRIVFMTKNLKYTLPLLIAIVLGSLGFSWNATEKDKEKLVLQLMYDALTSIHYQPKVVDDSLSSKVFDFYIKSLDSQKRFLHKGDIEELKAYRYQLDDELKSGSTDFLNKSIEISNTRFDEAKARYKKILSTPFDFTLMNYFKQTVN